MIVVINSGIGNIGAILNMLNKSGHTATPVTTPDQLSSATHIILPGVGAFDHGVSRLSQAGFMDSLESARSRGCAIMGICLGMQLFTERSDEGQLRGFGWIPGETVRFGLSPEMGRQHRIPNMGWSPVNVRQPVPLFTDAAEEQRFYFVHSYRVRCTVESDVAATSVHGVEFVAAVQRDNVVGVQFHPEKSHRYGMQLLDHFARWKP
jgi:glutamine amidotransferase